MKYISFLLLIVIYILCSGYSQNPPNVLGMYVNDLPGLPHCITCHSTGSLLIPDETGGLSFNFGNDESTFTSGEVYNLTLTLDHASVRNGFQMIATDSLKMSIGQFIANESMTHTEEQQDAGSGNTYQFVEHLELASTTDSSYIFQWQAPDDYLGTVKFSAVAVAANGNGVADLPGNGDTAYYQTWTIKSDFSAVIESTPVEEVSLFPNPTSDALYVSGLNELEISDVVVYNTQGKQFQTWSESNIIQVNHLPQGLYYLRLSGQDKPITLKFLKLDM